MKKQFNIVLIIVAFLIIIGASYPVIASADSNIKISDITNYFNNGDIDESLKALLIDDTESVGALKADTVVNAIIRINKTSLMDGMKNNDCDTIKEFQSTEEYKLLNSEIEAELKTIAAKVRATGLEVEICYSYNALFCGLGIKTQYKNISLLSDIEGVIGVEICNNYMAPETALSAEIMKVNITRKDFGYKGEGQLIAIIDTGLDVEHEAFLTMPTNPGYNKEYIAERIVNLSAYSGISWLCYGNEYTSDYTEKSMKVDYVYQNDKVIYAYDYADKDFSVKPAELAVSLYGAYHGTHVSGIAAGNNGKDFFGIAPEAQLAMLDVFSDNTGGSQGIDIYAAMNDAVLLGADVINMSLGSACGYVEDDYFQDAVDTAEEAGVILCVSAGNSFTAAIGNTWGNYSTTENLDFGTLSSPSSNINSLSIASINATASEISYIMSGDRKIFYADSIIKLNDNTQTTQNLNKILDDLNKNDIELEYVMIPGYGVESDFEGIDVNGKIAVMMRGNKVAFNDKVLNAEKRGAIGAIIYNDMEDGIRIGMSLPTAKIPAVFIDNEAGVYLSENATKTIKLSKSYVDKDTLEMSEFSSWGPVGNLILKPEITAPGGNIYSSFHNNAYAYCSGTSMSSPNTAGASALLIQALKEKYPEMSKANRKKLAQMLLMSTAVPAMDAEERYYSARKQGAGVVDIYAAINSNAYLSVDKYDNKSKIELGDDKERTGVYNIEYEVVNTGSKTLSYKLETITMCEAVGVYVADYDKYLCANYDEHLNPNVEYFVKNNDTLVSIDNSIEVNGNSRKRIVVKITLSDSDREYIEKYFPYGNYIEGYVRMYSDCGDVDLSMVYLGFFGDWTEAPYFDNSVYDDEMASIPYGYLTGIWNSKLGILGNYCFEHTSDMEIPAIDAEKACISVYGNGYNTFYSSVIGLMRNLKNYTYRITDKYTGETYYEYTGSDFSRKSYYVSGYGTIVPDEAIFKWEGESERYFYSQLPNNTECVFEFIGHLEGVNPEEENSVRGSWSVPLTIDSEKPQLVSSKFYLKDGKICMDAELYDNFYLMSAFLSVATENEKGEISRGKALQRYATPVLNQNEKSEKITLTFDLTDAIDYIVNEKRLIISVFDYAMNSSEFLIEFDELPDLGLPTTLTINNGNDMVLSINEQTHLNTIVGPKNYGLYLDYTYAWISSNENIVKVDDNGNIIAVDSGNTVISCIASFLDEEGELHSLIAQININVKERPQYAIFNDKIINIGIGESVSKLPILYPYENGKFIECEYNWHSNDEGIAKIIDNKIVGVAVGITELRCDVSCIINGEKLIFSATTKVNVLPLPSEVYFANEIYNIDKNDIMDVSIKLPENTAVQFTSIKYLSKDEAIVRIKDGKILGVNVGSAEINAICSYTENGVEKTLTATAIVNVNDSDKLREIPNKIDVYINGVLMSKNTYDMELNSEIIVTIVPDPWYADEEVRIYAFSGDRNAVMIDGNKIKAMSLGTVVIYADSIRKSSLYTSFTINIIEATEDTEGNTPNPDMNIIDNYSILSNSTNNSESTDFVINSENVLTEYKGNGGDVVIPDGVVAIDDKVFYQNMSIDSITLPDSLTTIGEYCFSESSIMRIVFGKGIVVIKKGAFLDCFDLSSIEFIAIEGKLAIEDKAFYSTSIKQLTLPEGTETIGKSAFEWTYLTEIKLADSITIINNLAFANTKIKSISLPAELTFIGEKAFEISSVVMDKLILPSKVETILKDAFNKCNIHTIFIPASVINIDFAEYSPNTNANYEIAEDNTYFYIENGCVYNEYKSLIAYLGTEKKVTIKEDTIRIAPNTFKIFGAEIVIIPESVKAIGDKALTNVNTICFNGNAPILEGGDSLEGYTNFDKNAYIFINEDCSGFDKLCWNSFNVMEYSYENILKISSVIIEAIENKVTITWDCSSMINSFRIYSLVNEERMLLGTIENQKSYTFDVENYGAYSFVVVGVINDNGKEEVGLDSDIMNIELTSEKANELDKLLAEYPQSENKAELFKEIETKFNELNALQKAQLKNLSILNEILNTKQIEMVNGLIAKAIETESEEDIANAKTAYNELSDELKNQTNYSSLVIYELEKANQIESNNYKTQLADAKAKSDAQAKSIEQLNEKVTLFIILFIVAACAVLALVVIMIIKSRKFKKAN